MADLHFNLAMKLGFMWPTRKNLPPNENNISLSIAEISRDFGFYVYAECNVNNVGSRRDLILINEKDKWVCQVEVKFNQDWLNYENDFWRVSLNKDLSSFLANKDRQSKHSIEDFTKYGLFIAGGFKPLHNWWTNSKADEWQNEWLTFQNPEKEISSVYGFVPITMNDNDKFGLGYFLINVNENSIEHNF